MVQYLRKNRNVRKVFQIKRTLSLPPISELDVLAHAAEEVTQKTVTPPVYSEDRNRDYHVTLDYAQSEMHYNVHLSEEQALDPNTVVNISNGLVGVQGTEPVPPSSMKTVKPKGKQQKFRLMNASRS